MYLITGFLLVFLGLLSMSNADTESNKLVMDENYDNYGEDWIFIPDGNNHLQVAVLKGEDIGARASFEFDDVKFLLYTRSDKNESCPLYLNNSESVAKSGFSPSRPTKLITHGWKSSGNSPSILDMKDAFLTRGDYNVIIIDWEPLANNMFYPIPMKNTKTVGSIVADFIDFLVCKIRVALNKIHIVGHSLGAHVAGNAGSSVKSGKIGRITGLDPAAPGFERMAKLDERLDKTDAVYVDVIHTCSGILGYLEPIGDADFYPNGGTAVQPGCCCFSKMMEGCSHGRSITYFTESINSDVGFLAVQCTSADKFISGKCENSPTTFMGEYVDPTSEGLFFLRTGSKSPFAISVLELSSKSDDCIESGSSEIDGNNTRICGTNSI